MSYMMPVPASLLAVLATGAPLSGFIFNDAVLDPQIDALRERQIKITDSQKAIYARMETENRADLTTEEKTEVDNLQAEFDKHEEDINRRQRLVDQQKVLGAPQGRVTEPEPNPADPPQLQPAPQIANQMRNQPLPSPGRVVVPATARVSAWGTHGFRHEGEFYHAVYRASIRGGEVDKRLDIRGAAATTMGTEGVGTDGGFAVPPDFRTAIMAKVFNQSSLLGLSFQMPVTGNSLTMPIDMTTPWQSTGGIQAFWDGEAVAATQSKPALEQITVRTSKLRALVPVTEELLEDASAMGAYLGRKAPEKIDFAISFAFTWGNGTGKPLGFMNAPCLVTAAAVGGQTADTINATNVSAMFASLPASSVPTAVWLVHPSAMAQLPLMVIGQMPVFLPPSGLAAAPNGTLLGRPVIPHQVCSSIGDVGDIMLVDMNEYLVPIKSGGVRQDVSIHLWFDQDITAFKFTIRLGGQPWWSAATASRAGTFPQSPFVTLAAR